MPSDGTLAHDWLDRLLLRRYELNYASGAIALAQHEISGVSQSIYHKPAGSWDWSWNYATEARIRGRKYPHSAYQWDAEARDTREFNIPQLSSFEEDYPTYLPDIIRRKW